MATIKKAQKGTVVKKATKVAGEMTGKMYKKSAIDKIGDKQAAELDKVSVFGKEAMKKKAKMADGGSLKPVDKSKNPGLAKLPKPVRNKMGYAKKGAKVAKKAMPCATCGKSMKKK